MPYLKIKGRNTKYYVTMQPFTSQHGYKAIRFKGDPIPSTNKGFIYYDDSDTEIADLSDYKYEYRPNEYTVQQDDIVNAVGNNEPLPPSAIDNINKRISTLGNRVSQLTPYITSKDVYIGDTECEFDLVREGNINAWLISGDTQTECTYTVYENKIIVTFNELEETGIVTISIQ